jgi:DNA polymerase-3 subunit alpha
MLEKQVTGFYISGHPLDDFKMTMDRFCTIVINDLKNDLKNLHEEKVMFAGMITDVQQKTSKKGAPFGIFTIEDFSGNMNLMIFNEDYLKRKHMLEIGNKVFLIAKIEERFHQKGNFDVRIEEMHLLSEAMSKLAKSITLSISATDIDDGLVSTLANLAKNNVGDCAIQVNIDDPDNGKILKLKTSTFKVEPRAFVHEIEKLNKLKFIID